MPQVPFIPTTMGLVPPGLVVGGIHLAQWSECLPFLGARSEGRYGDILQINKLCDTAELVRFLRDLKVVFPTPTTKVFKMADMVFQLLLIQRYH